jgi:putative oxidoreductase
MSNSSSSVVPLAGRLLISAVFLFSGLGKLMAFGFISGYIAAKGLPLPGVATAAAAAVELLAGLAILVGFQARLAAWILFLYLIPTTLLFHNFWALQGMERMDNQSHFLKNAAVMGGLLFVATFGPGAYSLDASSSAKA